MILILGGTTEGRTAAQVADEAGQPFYYSTKGDEQEIALHNGIRLTGAMDATGMGDFCRNHDIRLLIDAAHPFAEVLHQTTMTVSELLSLPLIRYERIYPPRNKELVWCNDYTDAMQQLEAAGIHRLLALTGVQTISRLRPYWQKHDCLFRILDRDSSRAIAAKQGFPPERIVYYHADADERIVLQKIRPQAVLLKESGLSGGFREKADAALAEGIPVFAIRRTDPFTEKGIPTVNGENGLRLLIDKLLPDFFPLHTGISTGTCATAATIAATMLSLFPESTDIKEVPVLLPNGETIRVNISDVYTASTCTATVIKESGDDPDVTNGLPVKASVRFTADKTEGEPLATIRNINIYLAGGEGVGRVTLPGLGIEPGNAAINAGPRRMITENLKVLLEHTDMLPTLRNCIVTISVPGGREISKRTFNPRLGIVDGISIIGTSGIVRPFSSEAFVNSIRKSMEVAKATKASCIVINSGGKSEHVVRGRYPGLPSQAFVHYGNFIGETLKIASEIDIPELVMGIMIGKAVKLAEGYMDTHSKKVTMNKEFLKEIACQASCAASTIERIDNITLARELWSLLSEEEKRHFFPLLLKLCQKHCSSLYKGRITILLISEEGEIL